MSRYFWPILTPSPCHTLSRIPEPPKYVTHLGPHTFFIRPSTKNSDKNLLNKKLGQKPSVQILSQLFVGFFKGSLVWKVLFGVLSVPLLSEYNRKLNITLNFRFHMYDNFFISVTSQALDPLSPCQKLSHLLGPPLPRA